MQAVCQINPSDVPCEGRQSFGLTARERQVIALVAGAHSNKDVAQKLGISRNTAKHHLSNVFDKLGVSNRLELLIFAVDHALIEED